MGRFLRRAGRFLANGAGSGLAMAAVGLVTGQGAVTTTGLQLAAGGVVKAASKKAGRGIHRVGSPLASLAVLGAAKAMGADMPVELAMGAAVDPGAATSAVQFLLNGLLPSALQSTTKNATQVVQDFRTRGAW